MKASRIWTAILGAAVLVSLLAGCSTTGEIDNPLVRRLTWSDFINGGDIRRACEAGDARYRLVLNANRAEQVRIYDLEAGGRQGAGLRARIFQPRWSPKDLPLSEDIWRMFAPTDRTVALGPAEADRLLQAIGSDLAGDSTPPGAILLSEWHFWIVSGCDGADPVFAVWTWPEAAYKALEFPALALALDPTGIPVNRPEGDRRLSRFDYNPDRQRGFAHYEIHVREDRVVLGADYGQDRSQ